MSDGVFNNKSHRDWTRGGGKRERDQAGPGSIMVHGNQ
jgi:hypothetical protein